MKVLWNFLGGLFKVTTPPFPVLGSTSSLALNHLGFQWLLGPSLVQWEIMKKLFCLERKYTLNDNIGPWRPEMIFLSHLNFRKITFTQLYISSAF